MPMHDGYVPRRLADPGNRHHLGAYVSKDVMQEVRELVKRGFFMNQSALVEEALWQMVDRLKYQPDPQVRQRTPKPVPAAKRENQDSQENLEGLTVNVAGRQN